MSEEYPRTTPPGGGNRPKPGAKPVSDIPVSKSRPPGSSDRPESKFESLQSADPQRPHHAKNQEMAEPTFEGKEAVLIPAGKKFPCDKCAGPMEFNPTAGNLQCTYCGNILDIPESENDVNELSFEKYFEQGSVAEQILEGAEIEARCDGCGANVVLPAHMKSDFCPFCNVQIKNSFDSAKPIMAPGGILPFKIEGKDARMLFGKWVKSRWFAPNALKEVDKLDKLQGVYLPYWTYDSMTFTFYTGQRGEDYTVTVGSGKNRRTETRTRWYPVSGNVRKFFDDVNVCASKTLPDKMIRDLEPWDLKMVVPYSKDYLSGFKAERYQISSMDGFHKAQEIMREKITDLVHQHIGGDRQRVSSMQTQHDGITFKYILLPLWLAAYQSGDKTYRVFVNARTGEVIGERPWSWVKITLAIMAGIIAIAMIILFLNS